MSLRKKWLHFYSSILNVHPFSVKGFGLHFSGMGFSRVVRMGMAVIFSMTSMVQATPKQREAVVKVVMAEIPWNQRPMKLTELMDYGKNFLPPILLQQLQANYMLYGDLEIPKMEVSRVKVGSSEHVRLTMTEKGITNTITLIDDGKVFARLNDKVDIYKEDMRSLTTVVSKVYQAIPVQPPKGPFLDDWDYRRLTPKGRLEYIKKLREIMVLMEKIQNNSDQGSTSDISKNFPFENSTSEAEVNFDQNSMTTTAGIFPHAGFSLTAAAGVFKSWWEYMLSGAEAAGGAVILAGGVYDSKDDYKQARTKAGCKGATIYCEPTMFPMVDNNQCISGVMDTGWTKACAEKSSANIKLDTFKGKDGNLDNFNKRLELVSDSINNICADKKKNTKECEILGKRKNEITNIIKEQTSSNAPSAQQPQSPATALNLDRIKEINDRCGTASLNGYGTRKLSTNSDPLGALQNGTSLISTGNDKERILLNESYQAYCQCAEPGVSVYDVAPSAGVAAITTQNPAPQGIIKNPNTLVLKKCEAPTPEKPAGGSGRGGGSSRRSQWWNPNSWCESSLCRIGVAIGAISIPIALGIMGYRQSMKMQDRQMKAQQEWYASMLGGGAATMPPTMSLYTPSALRPIYNIFNPITNPEALR